MNVRDLNGLMHSWHLTGHIAKGNIENKSNYHKAAKKLLINIFPTLQILEEVPITIRKSETLFLDFYLPLKKLCIEVHGEQHYKFVAFYHNNILNFMKSQKRDREKQEWCEINNIKYLALPYNENVSQWENKILYE